MIRWTSAIITLLYCLGWSVSYNLMDVPAGDPAIILLLYCLSQSVPYDLVVVSAIMTCLHCLSWSISEDLMDVSAIITIMICVLSGLILFRWFDGSLSYNDMFCIVWVDMFRKVWQTSQEESYFCHLVLSGSTFSSSPSELGTVLEKRRLAPKGVEFNVLKSQAFSPTSSKTCNGA